MELGNTFLKLDNDWEMQELADLAKLYTQCYSLVYSLSGDRIESADEQVVDWFHGVYAKLPWRGGYTAVNFYTSLYAKIPYEQRPQILEIRYASPGYIKLKEAALVAALLAGIVAAVTNSFDQIHNSYNKIQKGMSERKLRKLEVELNEIQLDKERLHFVQKAKQQLIDQMQIPQVMQEELIRRSSDNDLMQLKILMSFYRRVQPLANLELREMLKVESDSDD
jgi:hypothetical protein